MRKRKHQTYPDYFVREDGLVERAVDSKRYQKAGDLVMGRVLASGYRQFKLVDAEGAKRMVRANRLVCEVFHGPAPSPRHQAAHKDGVRLNNCADNLYWATPMENKMDSIRHGTSVRGETCANQHGPAKLTAADVLSMRAAYSGKRGELVRFADKHGVHPTCVRKAIFGETWAHVPGRSALDRREVGA